MKPLLVSLGVGTLAVCAFAQLPYSTTIQPSSVDREIAVNRGSPALWQSLKKLHTRASLMMITAHPDDCEFMCGGTVAVLTAAGWHVDIMVVTSGKPTLSSPFSSHASKLRVRSLKENVAVIGVQLIDLPKIKTGTALQVAVTVVNSGSGTMFTQPPAPGFTYAEGQSYRQAGFAEYRGSFRVGVDFGKQAFRIILAQQGGMRADLCKAPTHDKGMSRADLDRHRFHKPSSSSSAPSRFP